MRSGRIQDVEDGLSEMPHVILNQARVHDFYLEVMRNSPSGCEPDYSRRAGRSCRSTLTSRRGLPGDGARFERLDPGHEGEIETVRARYVVGCDGARSTVRRCIGRELDGDAANQAWGVMDVLAVTDFPDIRLKAVIQSARRGQHAGHPARGRLSGAPLHRARQAQARRTGRQPQHHRRLLIAAAQRILQPYSLEVKEVAWWSVYEIGQRLCDKFDDVPDERRCAPRAPRVFIAGDACHTHSPKAGQGMNVSMRDAFNLGWKLAAVLRRAGARREILHTYSAERQAVAKELIDFDRELAKMFSAPPKIRPTTGRRRPGGVPAYFVTARPLSPPGRRPSTGRRCSRASRPISTSPKGFVIGTRFHSAPVIRLADAKPMQLGHAVEADGRWRLFAFSGAKTRPPSSSGYQRTVRFPRQSPESPVRRYTPAGADIDSRDRCPRGLPAGPSRACDRAPCRLPAAAKGRYGLRDYEKMFCPDLKSGHDIFDMRGIDRDKGCMVIVRPDQYVAHVLPLDAHAELAAFFDGFMLRSGESRPLNMRVVK